MEERRVENWRDVTLLQLGALLKRGVLGENQEPYQEWLDLATNMRYAEVDFRKQEKAKGKKWGGFRVNTTRSILCYFFTYAAAVHRRFVRPDDELSLEELVRDYHLNSFFKVTQTKSVDFHFYFSEMIPHRTVSVGKGGVISSDVPPESNWIRRSDEECETICWNRILEYMVQKDAPGIQTKAGDALAWLEKRNRAAKRPIRSENGPFLFYYQFECVMGKAYPRFLEQMDAWNPKFLRLWEAFLEDVRNTVRELSAVLNGASVPPSGLPPVSGGTSAPQEKAEFVFTSGEEYEYEEPGVD